MGIVRALIDPQRAAAAYGIVTTDLWIAPGSAPLRTMLGHSVDRAAETADSDEIFTRARKAMLRVARDLLAVAPLRLATPAETPASLH